MRVLFSTAELAPFIKVGGLADASAGLVRSLRSAGVDVEVILPDYGWLPLVIADEEALACPPWVGPVTLIRGALEGFGEVSVVRTPSLGRPHPYVDSDGQGWPDNDTRFFSFSAAIAALVRSDSPDVLHLNDWHTGATLGFLTDTPPTVLTIHNLAYQGTASGEWLRRLPNRADAYEWYGGINPLTGAIALADRVVTVSPTFAAEVMRPETGFGLDRALSSRADAFTGILNGIDTEVWDPQTDPFIPIHYGVDNASRKREIGRRLAGEIGWEPGTDPLIGMVTRLTGQKGVDLALEVADSLPDLEARLILLGSGERDLADAAGSLAEAMPDRFAFVEGYDEALSHRIFAGSDLYLMPSRFEPAGLTQMQAMRYGSIPVVTDVGGLHDTVVDADADPLRGNGFVATRPTAFAVREALARAVAAWRSTRRRGEIRRRGMTHDWSWNVPARRYIELYEDIAKGRGRGINHEPRVPDRV